MAFTSYTRSAVAGLALVMAVGAGAQAAPVNIAAPAVAQMSEKVGDPNLTNVHYRRYGHRHHGYRNGAVGAGIALGALGLIAGATAYDRGYYRCDPYYDDCYPRRRVYRYYDEPRYYAPPPRRYYYGY